MTLLFTEDQKVELIRLLVERGVSQKIARLSVMEDVSISEAAKRVAHNDERGAEPDGP